MVCYSNRFDRNILKIPNFPKIKSSREKVKNKSKKIA